MSAQKPTELTGSNPSTSPAETRVIRAASVEQLQKILDDFSDALALVETAQGAMDAAEVAGAHLATLHRGIDDLRLVHRTLDLAVLGIRRGVK